MLSGEPVRRCCQEMLSGDVILGDAVGRCCREKAVGRCCRELLSEDPVRRCCQEMLSGDAVSSLSEDKLQIGTPRGCSTKVIL